MKTLTLCIDGLLAILGVIMFFRGKYGVTRQAAFLPLLTAVLDAPFAAQLSFSATPVLSVLLLLLQMIIGGSCAMVLYQDHYRARSKARRYQREHALERSRARFEQAMEEGRKSVSKRACA